jgi:hypothetical protein
MIYKTLSTLPNHVWITFELPASVWADHIFVVGDFNQWCATATPMCQDRDGILRATIDLPWGARSEFRYLIDGQWQTDYHADSLAGGPPDSTPTVWSTLSCPTKCSHRILARPGQRIGSLVHQRGEHENEP